MYFNDVIVDAENRELLDVRSVVLESLTLRAARGGGSGALRLGPPLLTAPAHLTLRIELNLSPTHNGNYWCSHLKKMVLRLNLIKSLSDIIILNIII